MKGFKAMFEVKQEDVEYIATLSIGKGERKELTRIRYNGEQPQLNLRAWKQGEGRRTQVDVTLTNEEAFKLLAVFESMYAHGEITEVELSGGALCG